MQTMLKDEADALVEGIEYHALLGVEHFYIYDNNRWAHRAEGHPRARWAEAHPRVTSLLRMEAAAATKPRPHTGRSTREAQHGSMMPIPAGTTAVCAAIPLPATDVRLPCGFAAPGASQGSRWL